MFQWFVFEWDSWEGLEGSTGTTLTDEVWATKVLDRESRHLSKVNPFFAEARPDCTNNNKTQSKIVKRGEGSQSRPGSGVFFCL